MQTHIVVYGDRMGAKKCDSSHSNFPASGKLSGNCCLGERVNFHEKFQDFIHWFNIVWVFDIENPETCK